MCLTSRVAWKGPNPPSLPTLPSPSRATRMADDFDLEAYLEAQVDVSFSSLLSLNHHFY